MSEIAFAKDNDWSVRKVAAPADEEERPKRRERAAMYEFTPEYLYRRAFSEVTLLDLFGTFDFKVGRCYNFLTAGDIDGMSYLKALLRLQSLRHCIVSTWCMSAGDAFQLITWIEGGGDQATGPVRRGDLQRELRSGLGSVARILCLASWLRPNGYISQPLEDHRRDRRALRLRPSDLRQLRHEPKDGAGKPVDRRGALSLLQGVF